VLAHAAVPLGAMGLVYERHDFRATAEGLAIAQNKVKLTKQME
jgi:hypothetical protein